MGSDLCLIASTGFGRSVFTGYHALLKPEAGDINYSCAFRLQKEVNYFFPGGYMLYLAMTKLPSCRLGLDYHFESNEPEVAQIRQVYKTVWM